VRRLLFLAILTSCGHGHPSAALPDAPGAFPDAPGVDPDAAATDGGAVDAAAGACASVTDTAPVTIATADHAAEYTLSITANSESATSWGTAGNEAVVLEIAGSQRGFIGHVILHQGKQPFAYDTHVGALDAGEAVTVKVSPLTAPNAMHSATACSGTLVDVTTLGASAAGVTNAPVYRWPAQKAFNDVPLLVGWSKARSSYQSVMTNEDGGTAEQCGGGASGMQAEIGRWGRSTDIEGHYGYGGAAPTWERCTGRVPVTTTALRMEAKHPILYWGDGHNRLFENRSGYGATCGTDSPEKPDGDFAGWNVQNPSNALADDTGRVIVLRPVPVDMDALGYAQFGGRREGLADHYAPWLYRIASLELARENKIDSSHTFGMSRYLYVDVRVSDVGGSGDSFCSPPLTLTGGFVLRAVLAGGATAASNQTTGDYASSGNHDWKRVAIPLPAGTTAADIDHFVFDAYDGDGIYLTAIGDAFIPVSDGTTNGAKLDYVRQGTNALQFYVDDDNSGCTNNTNSGGPGGLAYTCAGGSVVIAR
jgi:hypothetical protein